MKFKGVGGQIELFEDRIVITRSGILGFMTQGLKGAKVIPFPSITAVQFKKATAFTSGYIQFTVKGGNESRGGLFAATTDENSVMFRQGEQANAFVRLNGLIEAAIKNSHDHLGGDRRGSPADEVEKLAVLRDRGIITDDEFQQKKRNLLGL